MKSAADGTGVTISSTISYVAHIRSAQSHNDNPIAKAMRVSLYSPGIFLRIYNRNTARKAAIEALMLIIQLEYKVLLFISAKNMIESDIMIATRTPMKRLLLLTFIPATILYRKIELRQRNRISKL